MSSVSSRTTVAAACTAAGSPSSVTMLPRRYSSQATWPSSARSTESPEPASSAATSLESSICLRTELLPGQRGHALAVGARADLRHRRLHDLPEILRRRGPGLSDGLADDPAQLGFGHLGGKVGLDELRLALLDRGQLVATALAKRRCGLQPALALAPQDRDLVGVARLRGLLHA